MRAMRRVEIPELLDTDSGTPEEISASLSDLWRINRWFGGVGTTQSMIEHVTQKRGVRSLSVLEVASGNGAVPQAVEERLRRRGIQLQFSFLDRAHSHFDRQNRNGTAHIAADARALPFADGSFDLVSSCIFVHHLSPEDLVQFMNEGLRVCRTAMLINDVVRHPVHLALVYAGLPLFRSRLTWHDAPASVRQAYTAKEIRDLLKQTPAKGVNVHRHYLFRMGVIAWK